MATLTQIRQGLAANLAALDGGYQVSAYMLANPTPPAIQVVPTTVTYDRAMHRGLDELSFQVQALFALTSDIGVQVRLDELLEPTGTGSLKTAVESDKKLGGAVADLHVTEATGYQIAQGANGPLLVCSWTVQVMANN